jgi:hypothetical protein
LKNYKLLGNYLPYLLAFGLLILLLISGLLLNKDFGVPVDETYQLQIAQKNHSYVFNHDPALLSFKDRYYGVAFELPLFWVTTRFKGPETVYVRHLLLYLAFLASLAIFYFLSLRLFRNPWWGFLAVCMLALSPRIFSDSFYNSKDIAFMDVFILAIWTLVINLDIPGNRKTTTTFLLVIAHALASALLIGTRIVGVMIVPMSVILVGIALLAARKSWKRILALIALYLVITAGLTILFWPILWHDPIHEFINAFQQMSRYNVYGKGVLFQGQFYPSDALPWRYLPVWISISTPIIILAGFVVGFGDWISGIILYFRQESLGKLNTVYKWISDLETLHWLAIIGWLAIPILSVFLFNSVLYNGWRHLFFIYPAIVLFSTRGFLSLYTWLLKLTGKHTKAILIVVVILAVGFFEPISFLIRYPRYGTVYFNQLAGDPQTLRKRFELDYWGISYKEAIDYILATDKSDQIPIYIADVSGLDYINSVLSPEQKARFDVLKSPDDGARYFIGNYSFHPNEYYPSNLEYFSIDVRGTKILAIYRFKN